MVQEKTGARGLPGVARGPGLGLVLDSEGPAQASEEELTQATILPKEAGEKAGPGQEWVPVARKATAAQDWAKPLPATTGKEMHQNPRPQVLADPPKKVGGRDCHTERTRARANSHRPPDMRELAGDTEHCT